MALTEQAVIDQISADEFGNVAVRTRTDIVRDGEVVAFSYHRRVISPEDDISKEPARVAGIVKEARKGAKPKP